MYNPVFEFTDKSLNTRKFEIGISSYPAPYEIGEKVKIIYSRKNHFILGLVSGQYDFVYGGSTVFDYWGRLFVVIVVRQKIVCKLKLGVYKGFQRFLKIRSLLF